MRQWSWVRKARLICGTLVCVAAFGSAAAEEEWPSSVVGTEFDFITDEDPDAFLCLEFKFEGWREMPDKRGDTPLIQRAYVFVAYFTDGTQVDIAIDDAFGSEENAREEALRYTPRLGRLPTSLRRGLEKMVIHEGGRDTTAFGGDGQIILYSDNATKRISTHDLEETVFHESVHASWDNEHRAAPGWLAAQRSDQAFVTRYARRKPDREDLAETALFAFTVLHHPGRLPADVEARIKKVFPARLAYIRKLVPPGKPYFFQVGPRYACDGSGKTFRVDAPREDEDEPDPDEDTRACTVDLAQVGTLSDIVSNALYRSLGVKESAVHPYLGKAKRELEDPEVFLQAVADHFGIERALLNAAVREYYHCNCGHGPLDEDPAKGHFAFLGDRAPSSAPETASTTAGDASERGPAPSPSPLIYLGIAGLLVVLLFLLLRVRSQGSRD